MSELLEPSWNMAHYIHLLVVALLKKKHQEKTVSSFSTLVIPSFSSIWTSKFSAHPNTNATKPGDELELSGSPAKRCGYAGRSCKARFWTSFSSPEFPRACGRLGTNHKHGPGRRNVIVRWLAVCLTAGWNRLQVQSSCKGVSHILRNVVHSNAVIIYKCIHLVQILYFSYTSLISPNSNCQFFCFFYSPGSILGIQTISMHVIPRDQMSAVAL